MEASYEKRTAVVGGCPFGLSGLALREAHLLVGLVGRFEGRFILANGRYPSRPWQALAACPVPPETNGFRRKLRVAPGASVTGGSGVPH